MKLHLNFLYFTLVLQVKNCTSVSCMELFKILIFYDMHKTLITLFININSYWKQEMLFWKYLTNYCNVAQFIYLE